jgi:hypothetical protein
VELTFSNVHKVEQRFDYVRTLFDNGVKYGVWYLGKAPLNATLPNRIGRHIGQVARVDYNPYTGPYREEWYAAPAYGSQNAIDLQWHGPFRSRQEASVFLTGLFKGHSDATTEIAEG